MADQAGGLLSPFLRERRIGAIKDYLKRGMVLDYGCGVGELVRYVEPSRYLGLDIDGASIDQARERHPAHTFMTLEEYERNDLPRRFEVVVGLALIEHVPDPRSWLKEVHRFMAPSGILVLTTPHPRVRALHEFGARLGVFSREAAEEHNVMVDHRMMIDLAAHAGFDIDHYERFLLGCNQLLVLQRKA